MTIKAGLWHIKNTSWSIFSYPLRILKTSIKSRLNLRVSSVVKPSIFNLSSYPISDKSEINFVALFCTLSKTIISFLRQGLRHPDPRLSFPASPLSHLIYWFGIPATCICYCSLHHLGCPLSILSSGVARCFCYVLLLIAGWLTAVCGLVSLWTGASAAINRVTVLFVSVGVLELHKQIDVNVLISKPIWNQHLHSHTDRRCLVASFPGQPR